MTLMSRAATYKPTPTSPGGSRKAIVIALSAAALVIAIVVALVVVKLSAGGGSNKTTLASSDVMYAVTHIPQATFDKVGIGTTSGPAQVFPPEKTTTPKTLTLGGKPLVVYEGADFCPYCAAERWPLVIALSKFGTFKNLATTTSSSTDVYPNTSTFSFYHSTYSSPYLDFQGVEEQTNTGVPLQKPTPFQQKLYNAYERVPYIPKPTAQGIPFVDFGNRYVIVGVSYSPQMLRSSSNDPLSMGTIAGSLLDPSLGPAQSADAAANYMIGALCNLTKGVPTSVCSTAAAKQAQTVLRVEPVAGSGNAGSSTHPAAPAAG